MKLAILPVIALVFISGCIELPNIFGPQPKGEVNDLITIREGLKAFPAEIQKGQPTQIQVPVINNLPATENQIIPVNVKLLNWCSPLLTVESVECPEDSQKTDSGCQGIELGPQRTQIVNFNLKAEDIEFTCTEILVELSYEVSSQSVTEFKFMNLAEKQRQESRGTYKKFQAKPSEGRGPVKVFFEIKDNVEQPIPTESSPVLRPLARLKVKNAGTGDLVKDEVFIQSITPPESKQLLSCKDAKGNEITESSTVKTNQLNEFVCDVKISSHSEVQTEQHHIVVLNTKYNYKVERSVSVKVENPQ